MDYEMDPFIKEHIDIIDKQYVVLSETESFDSLIDMECNYEENKNEDFDYKTETIWDKIKSCCCLCHFIKK